MVRLGRSLCRTYNDPSGVHQHSVNFQISPRAANMGIFSCSMWGGISGRSELNVNEINTSTFDCVFLNISTATSAEWFLLQSEKFLAMGNHLQIQRLQRFSRICSKKSEIADTWPHKSARFRMIFYKKRQAPVRTISPQILSLAITQNCLSWSETFMSHS